MGLGLFPLYMYGLDLKAQHTYSAGCGFEAFFAVWHPTMITTTMTVANMMMNATPPITMPTISAVESAASVVSVGLLGVVKDGTSTAEE